MELAIETIPNPERYIVAVSGEIDISCADKLRAKIDFALEQPTEEICLDFAQVGYIDSTGIGVLVGAAHRAAERQKRFSVINAQPAVVRVAQLLGLDEELGISAA